MPHIITHQFIDGLKGNLTDHPPNSEIGLERLGRVEAELAQIYF
ncbi:hypothetical protein [Rhodohalobacter sp.]|nr:hypothetical protein [Rhodohalobacter sp.]MDZ7756763.1 hypothetical protein [Rhodohalobacter sp.]